MCHTWMVWGIVRGWSKGKDNLTPNNHFDNRDIKVLPHKSEHGLHLSLVFLPACLASAMELKKKNCGIDLQERNLP